MTGARVGIDVGGTKCLAVALDETGQIVAELRRATPRGPEALLSELVGIIAEVVGEVGGVRSLGVGLPGLVTRDGTLVAAPNLVDIRSFEVGRLLRERVEFEVHIDNDATCACVGEWRAGVAMGHTEMVMATLGTGIGGGVVSAGGLLRGAHGFAGEFGHMVVDPDGPPCPCGRRGCWERFASGSGLGRLAREAAAAGRLTRVVELADGDLQAIRGEHVQTAAREGDLDALRLVDEFARWVAIGLVNLANAFDPDLLVLGGGLATAPDVYLAPIAAAFEALLYASGSRPLPAVRFATLGEHAGAVGAAMLVDVHTG
ncbi:MAG: ROK family protein [Ilumatobacteraceae bacterium]